MQRLPWNRRLQFYKAVNYQPVSESALAAHQSDAHRVLVAGGEDGGKSYWLAYEMGPNLLAPPPPGRIRLFTLAGPTYSEPRKEFEYLEALLDDIGVLDRSETPKEGQWRLHLLNTGNIVETRSLEDVGNIRAYKPDGIGVCEAGKCQKTAIERLIGRGSAYDAFMLLTGCLVGDTMVITDSGIETIGEIVGDGLAPEVINHYLPTRYGVGKAVRTWRNLPGPIVVVNFTKGFEIAGTPDHRVVTRSLGGTPNWKALNELAIGDSVALQFGQEFWGHVEIESHLAYFAGLYTAEGYCSGSDRFTITTADLGRLLASKGFIQQHGTYHWRKTDHGLAQALRDIGCDLAARAKSKRVPTEIMRSRRDAVVHFLRGLFDGDGCAHRNGAVTYATSSRRLASQVQMLLLNLGIVAGLSRKTDKLNGKPFDSYNLALGAFSGLFYERVGFSILRKHARRDRSRGMSHRRGGSLGGFPIEWLKVRSKAQGFDATYDISVEAHHSYVANGLVAHNTFEMSEQWYHNWFRLGQVANNGMRLESYSLPTWENAANYPGGREDPKITEMERIYPPDYFLERCAAVPVPPSGLVLKHLDVKRHLDPGLNFDPARGPAILWVDPGYGGAYAVEVIQAQGQRVFGIDEIYEAGLTSEEMIGLCKKRPWWDAVSKRGVIDFAGKQHQASESVIEQWRRLAGIRLDPPVDRPVRVYEAVERIETSLHRDQIVLSPRMAGALKEANIGEGPVPGMRPWRFKTGLDGTVIDRNSTEGFDHAWMAIAYGLLDQFGFVTRLRGGTGPVPYLRMGPALAPMTAERRLGPVKVA